MIAIRAATGEDAAALAAIYAPYVRSSGVSFEQLPPTPEEMAGRINKSPRYPWLVAVDENDTVLGYAYASSFRERHAYRFVVETSIYMAGDQRGKGVGRLLYGALVATLKRQNFTQAIAVIALPNDWSIALHESVGFRRAGMFREVGYKAGSWIDIGFWQATLDKAHVPPDEPRDFAEVGVVRG